jgi:hypothetical protein
MFIRIVLGKRGYRALKLGRLWVRGEFHLWMYDRFSLKKLLKETGFTDIRMVSPSESMIEGWSSYCLDAEPDGAVYKPGSLYMEAIKP